MITITTIMNAIRPWIEPENTILSPKILFNASNIISFEQKSMAHVDSMRRVLAVAVVFPLKKSATRCSATIVNCNKTCSNNATISEIEKLSIKTFPQYSLNRLITVRSIRTKNVYLKKSCCRLENDPACLFSMIQSYNDTA